MRTTEITKVELEDRFFDAHNEEIQVHGITLDSLVVLKEMDAIAYNEFFINFVDWFFDRHEEYYNSDYGCHEDKDDDEDDDEDC